MKIFYYQPLVTTIAANGSERLGAQATTKYWAEDNPTMKIEITQSGKTIIEVQEKLKKFLSHENYETVELPCEYYLCSKAVIDFFKPFEVSKPITSGYDWDKEEDLTYVAWINFAEVDTYYNSEFVSASDLQNFSCWECIEGNIEVDKISISKAKKNGFYVEMENKVGLTLDKNRAMIIRNMADSRNITPVELINLIYK